MTLNGKASVFFLICSIQTALCLNCDHFQKIYIGAESVVTLWSRNAHSIIHCTTFCRSIEDCYAVKFDPIPGLCHIIDHNKLNSRSQTTNKKCRLFCSVPLYVLMAGFTTLPSTTHAMYLMRPRRHL